MAAGDPATQHQAVLQTRMLEKLVASMDRLGARIDAATRAGGGGVGGGRGGRGGGLGGVLAGAARGGAGVSAAGALGRLAGAAGPAGIAAAAAGGLAAAAAPVVGGGLLQASRGGSFAAGAIGAGVNLLAGMPGGELTGASAVQRVTEGATADLNAATNQVARFAPEAVTPRVRQFLAGQAIEQNMNLEADRQANSTLINQMQYGGGVAGVLEQAKTINHMVVSAGYQQWQ